jgi:hypothetical protein
MKTAKHNKWTLVSWRSLSFVAVAMFVAILSTACGNKGGGGTTAVGPGVWNPGVYPSCQGCPPNGSAGFLANAVARQNSSSYGQPIELNLNFFGDGQYMAQYQMYQQQGFFYGNPSASYRGPFSASGVMFIPYPLSECGVAPGNYQLQTIAPGVWGNDGAGRSGEGIRMQLMGPSGNVQMVMSGYITPVTPPIPGRDGRTYPYQFVSQVRIVGPMSPYPCDVVLY